MFGVLLVRTETGEEGVLRAFSGKLNGSFHHPGWVPPMLELSPSKLEIFTKQRLEEMKRQLQELAKSPLYRDRHLVRLSWEEQSNALERRLKGRKKERDLHRAAGFSEEELAAQSKHDSREKREFKKNMQAALEPIRQVEEKIGALKAERKSLSRSLQAELYERFEAELWREVPWSLASLFPAGPPTGTGECCAPKLLHFARLHRLQPLALAEFWWGESTLERRKGEFYPPCEERCRPLLGPLLTEAVLKIPVTYHDAHLVVVDKPSGLLTVPGRQTWNQDSIVNRLEHEWGKLFPVHRLDLATSGLVILARDPHTQGRLQGQFAERTVRKLYQAVLEGLPTSTSGKITAAVQGKSATSLFRLLDEHERRVELEPLTGRTHQLRLHCARDLQCPIEGDAVYGSGEGARLKLHARLLEFQHPVSGTALRLETEVPF